MRDAEGKRDRGGWGKRETEIERIGPERPVYDSGMTLVEPRTRRGPNASRRAVGGRRSARREKFAMRVFLAAAELKISRVVDRHRRLPRKIRSFGFGIGERERERERLNFPPSVSSIRSIVITLEYPSRFDSIIAELTSLRRESIKSRPDSANWGVTRQSVFSIARHVYVI